MSERVSACHSSVYHEKEMRAQQTTISDRLEKYCNRENNTEFSFLSIKMRPICTKNANTQDPILIAVLVASTASAAVSTCNCRSHLGTIGTHALNFLFSHNKMY